MRSTLVTRASAILLGLAGAALLFAPVEILTRIAPSVPVDAAWLAQLLAAAWLALAAMNWITRFTMVGGIYGRAVVASNAAVYFVSAMVLLSAMRRGIISTPIVVLGGITLVMAAVYSYLLFRGPFASDRLQSAQGATGA